MRGVHVAPLSSGLKIVPAEFTIGCPRASSRAAPEAGVTRALYPGGLELHRPEGRHPRFHPCRMGPAFVELARPRTGLIQQVMCGRLETFRGQSTEGRNPHEAH